MVDILVHLHSDPETLLHYISQVKTNHDDVYEQAVDAMCRDHLAIQVVPYTGAWTPIKYPWHVLDAVRYFLTGRKIKFLPISDFPHAVLDGKVIIEDGVKILENAVVRGPVYIGRNSVIGNNAWSELTATSALIVWSVLARKSRNHMSGTALNFT